MNVEALCVLRLIAVAVFIGALVGAPTNALAAPQLATAAVSTSVLPAVPGFCSGVSLKLSSSAGVSAAQVSLDIPAALSHRTASTTGFLSGATHLDSGTEHRWFRLGADGSSSASFDLPFDIPSGVPVGTTYSVAFKGIGLRDTTDTSVSVQASFPINLSVTVSKPTVQMVFQALDDYFASKFSNVTCGAVPKVVDIFNLLDAYFK